MFTTHIRSVEPNQVRTTGKYWSPDNATVVVVGDAQKIQKSLEKYGSVSSREAASLNRQPRLPALTYAFIFPIANTKYSAGPSPAFFNPCSSIDLT